MPTYVYETIPTSASEAPERFEVRQSMSEPSLSAHPESGVPVRRVLSGGLATFTEGASSSAARSGKSLPVGGGGCGAGCACVS